MHYVYILRLNTNTLYAGRTDNLERRIAEHKAGKVRSTNKKNPELVFYEAYKAKEDSVRRERYFKTTKGKTTLKIMLQYSMN